MNRCESRIELINTDTLAITEYLCDQVLGHPGLCTRKGSIYPGNSDPKKRKDYCITWACAGDI